MAIDVAECEVGLLGCSVRGRLSNETIDGHSGRGEAVTLIVVTEDQ